MPKKTLHEQNAHHIAILNDEVGQVIGRIEITNDRITTTNRKLGARFNYLKKDFIKLFSEFEKFKVDQVEMKRDIALIKNDSKWMKKIAGAILGVLGAIAVTLITSVLLK